MQKKQGRCYRDFFSGVPLTYYSKITPPPPPPPQIPISLRSLPNFTLFFLTLELIFLKFTHFLSFTFHMQRPLGFFNVSSTFTLLTHPWANCLGFKLPSVFAVFQQIFLAERQEGKPVVVS